MKTLSIIIVNYNTAGLLRECIKSIVKTTERLTTPSTEIIIVDNGSTDSFASSINRLDNIIFIKNQENRGFAKATNQGIRKARGKYILLLNPDTIVQDNTLLSLTSFAQSRPDVGVVGPRLFNPDSTIQESVFRFPSVANAILEFWLGVKKYSKFAPKEDAPIDVDAVVGAAMLITREAIKRVGLLDEKYFMYFEDIDYCRRVKKSGLKIFYLPTAEVIHYHGVSGKTLVGAENQWRRLIPSSKIYHGVLKHYILNLIIWFGTRVLHRFGKNEKK